MSVAVADTSMQFSTDFLVPIPSEIYEDDRSFELYPMWYLRG